MAVLEKEDTLFLGGKWQAAHGDAIDIVNPATEECLASVPSATSEDVENALAFAHEAQPAWANSPAPTRSKYLREMADILHANADRLVELLVDEVGKPVADAQGEIDWAVEYIRYTSEWDRRIEGDIVPSDNRDETIHLMRVPVGVIAAICPWNYPIALYFRKAAPALVAGNSVVVKPSEVTPLAVIAATKLVTENLDLPRGVLNLVTGGAGTGRALVRSPQTNMVTFTGHRDTGKMIMVDAAPNLTRVALELGGKAPAIVLADADIALAVRSIITARHANSGQICSSAERVFVHSAVFEEFVGAYTAAAREIRVGHPRTDVDMGPLANAEQFEKTSTAVAHARDEGAQIALGGGRPAGESFAKGYWFQPTVVLDVSPEMSIMQEETFGPITPIMKVESVEEAIQYANESRYGLTAYVFSSDYRTVMRAARDINFGELYINRTLGEQPQAHHIGYRESGLGGEDGKYGVLKYTQVKSVYHNFG